jgi:UrcA family protein
MIKVTKWVLTNFSLASCILAMTPAFAEPATKLVSYTDLNLASPAGRATLQERIDRAVTSVCGRATQLDTLGALRAIKQCRADATRDAVVKVAALADGHRQLASRGAGIVIASR